MSTTNPTPKSPAPKKKAKAGPVFGVIAAVVALFIGVSIGNAGEDAPADAPPPEVKTVTKTVEVEKVPDVCLDALDRADKANELAAEGFGYAGDAMIAAGSFDVDGMDSATADINNLAPKYQDSLTQYVLSAAQCRDAGK